MITFIPFLLFKQHLYQTIADKENKMIGSDEKQQTVKFQSQLVLSLRLMPHIILILPVGSHLLFE